MSTLLAVVLPSDGDVKRADQEVLTRCRELAEANGHTPAVAIIAPDASDHVEAVEQHGAEAVYTVDDPIFGDGHLAPLLDATTTVIEAVDPRVAAFSSSETVGELLGALAVRTDATALPEVTSFELRDDGGVDAVRPVMAAKAMARTQSTTDRTLVSVRAAAYEAEEQPAAAHRERDRHRHGGRRGPERGARRGGGRTRGER